MLFENVFQCDGRRCDMDYGCDLMLFENVFQLNAQQDIATDVVI